MQILKSSGSSLSNNRRGEKKGMAVTAHQILSLNLAAIKTAATSSRLCARSRKLMECSVRALEQSKRAAAVSEELLRAATAQRKFTFGSYDDNQSQL